MLTTLSFPCLSMKPSVSPHDYSLSDINLWTTENDFKLNSNKSELHIVGSKSALVEMTTFTLSIDGCTHTNLRREGRVSALVSVPLSFTSHISNISWIAFFWPQNISRLCPARTQHSTLSLSQSSGHISHWLLHCDPGRHPQHTYSPSSSTHPETLQQIIKRSKSTEHVTPLLIQSMWHYGSTFKILLFTFKSSP